MAELITYWLIALNLAAFAAFGLDKARAETGKRRIRENTLLTFALLGGSPGAYAGRYLFRHKTKKHQFNASLARVVILQIILLVGVLALSIAPEGVREAARDRIRWLAGDYSLFRSPTEVLATEASLSYSGCDEIRLLGRAPLYRGQPGFRESMDGDSDGAACEPYK